MLLGFFKHLLKPRSVLARGDKDQISSLEKATELMARGDRHAAVTAFRDHLKLDPYNIQALNDLGVCLADIGNMAEASATFELAYSLDDSYTPVVVNHAKLLHDLRRSTDALPFLQKAKVAAPDFAHVDAVYAGLCLTLGDVVKARHFQRRAWLSDFDNLRLANCHLFYAAYDDIDEAQMAAEHLFWAETARPVEVSDKVAATPRFDEKLEPPHLQKIRIGYWSPDFRNHSVRYFFRPLLESHDQAQFEVFLYHDFPKTDAQTELMQGASTHFHDVCELSDAGLHELIESHQLDIFVELAGHSSHNRVTLLQQRFATLQITALGYPPTTGLKTIDAKLLDRHVVTLDSSRYYAEAPLVLPTSFWCFDPMEDAPVAPEPPSVRNGYVTFGCVGNTAKINGRILRCWKSIFDQVPNYRVLIRSINFEDPAAEEAMRQRLIEAEIPLDKVDLRKPEGGAAFFDSYNQIDIILDTFPFNGGTTTCFSTFMGVPVVSLTGASLISRMGLSILSNLGVPDLAVASELAYVERAVALAQDSSFLHQFKREARGRFQQSSLGNGKLFALEFEQACKELLAHKKTGSFTYQNAIALLPADEITRRAYAVLRSGQADAAQRILNHCLSHYPDHGSAHLLTVQRFTADQRFEEAADYLLARFDKFTHAEQISALISVVRFYLLLGWQVRAAQMVEKLTRMRTNDEFDRMQVQLYLACSQAPAKTAEPMPWAQDGIRRFHVLIPCDNPDHFDAMREQFSACCQYPDDWTVVYERCDEARRITAYETALLRVNFDILVIVQKNIAIHNALFFVELAKTLDHCDIVGFAGATRWQRLDWRIDEFACKTAGFWVTSSEKPGWIEIQFLGTKSGPIVHDMAVLDGSLLAFNANCMKFLKFDAELEGAELLLEEDCIHAAFQSGLRLAVHRNLGVFVDQQVALDARYRAAGRMRIAEKLGFDPFAILRDDHLMLSVPVASASDAICLINNFWETSE